MYPYLDKQLNTIGGSAFFREKMQALYWASESGEADGGEQGSVSNNCPVFLSKTYKKKKL